MCYRCCHLSNKEKFAIDIPIKNFIKNSQPGTKKLDKPLYIVQGTADTNVPYILTQAMVQRIRDLGSLEIKLNLVTGVQHTHAIVYKNLDI